MSGRAILPTYTTPDELAAHLGVSERELRRRARELGACREMGKRMIFLEGDIQRILEEMKPCRSGSTCAAQSGTTAAAPPAGGYEALQALRTESSLSGSRPKPKPKLGVVSSTNPRRK
jgi:hypothetical protein